jgi:hypothetical protein
MRHQWQNFNDACLFCHSWRDRDGSIITAMTFLLILLAMAVAMSFETIRLVIRDGRGPQRPPASHFDDPQFRAPGRA